LIAGSDKLAMPAIFKNSRLLYFLFEDNKLLLVLSYLRIQVLIFEIIPN